LFDPKGETGRLLETMGARQQWFQPMPIFRPTIFSCRQGGVTVGDRRLTSAACATVKVIVFEHTSEALEKRLGFRSKSTA